jgi:MFS family permease
VRTHDRAAHAGWSSVAVTHVSPSAAGAQEELERANATPPRRWPSEGDFWRLWLIGMVQFGVRWIEMLAVGIFVYQQTGSALLVTLLTLLRTLPLALFGAFVGAAADRLEGRTVLLLNTLVLMATSLTIALLAITGHLAIWHLAVATFISGTMWSTDMGVRRLMIGRVVGAARMGYAMVFDAGANNVTRMAGPVLRTIFDAVELARRDRRLLGILAITLIFNLFAWPNLSLIPVIGKDSLGLGPSGVGLLAAMEGLGAILGVVAVYFLGRPALYPKLYVYSVMAYLAAFTTFAMLPGPSAAGLALLIAGIGGSGFAITQSTLAFQSTRPEMRGRILGLISVAIGTGPIGFLQLGLLADAFGAQLAIIISGCEGLLALLLTRPLWRAIRIDATSV